MSAKPREDPHCARLYASSAAEIREPLTRRFSARECIAVNASGGDALIPPLRRKFLIYPSSRFALRLRAARD
jgi:hypothetical protein